MNEPNKSVINYNEVSFGNRLTLISVNQIMNIVGQGEVLEFEIVWRFDEWVDEQIENIRKKQGKL